MDIHELAKGVLNCMGWIGISCFIILIAGCIVSIVGLSITNRWRG